MKEMTHEALNDEKQRPLNPAEITVIMERLLERKKKLWNEVVEDLEHDVSAEYQDLIRTIKDHGDVAFAELKESTAFKLIELKARELEQIEMAFRRRDDGDYGRCEDCGQWIPPARLKAMPYATRCLECQSRWERIHLPEVRK